MNIVESNGTYSFFNEVTILDELRPGNYSLDWDARGNCFLSRASEFSLPTELFDIEADFRKHILTSFNHFTRNLGVLMHGYKGQGKTVTAKLLCNESQLPVILISKKVPVQVDFVSFLNDIKQKCVVFIDEFEKLFPNKEAGYSIDKEDVNNHNQNSFLPLMDGATSSTYKKLFIFTTNNAVNDFFINRPSRVRYYKTYEFMDKSLFDLIIEHRLEDKSFKTDIEEGIALTDCTIDLLISIIDEINLHKVPYSSFKEIFNHKPRKITYMRDKYDGDKFVYLDCIEEVREVSRDSSYIASEKIEILSVKGGYIIYKARNDEWDEEGDKIISTTYNTYRLKKSLYLDKAF